MTLVLLLAALLASPAVVRARSAAEISPSASPQTVALAHLVECAAESTFVLVVEPGAGEITLELQGAVLRTFPVQALELVTPRLGFLWRRGDRIDAQWMAQIWRGGQLDPVRKRDRVEITAPPPDPKREASEDLPVPPTPEEAIVAPERFFVRFTEGLSLEIRATPHRRARFEDLRVGLQDRLAALRPHAEDRARLRLSLAPDDSDALYRSLPPDVGLLILPPTLRADGSEVAAAGN